MQKITPFLWFNDNAVEASGFYSSVFRNSSVKESRYGRGNSQGFRVEEGKR